MSVILVNEREYIGIRNTRLLKCRPMQTEFIINTRYFYIIYGVGYISAICTIGITTQSY